MEPKIKMPYRGRKFQPGIDLVAPVEMKIKRGDRFRIVEVAFDAKTLDREQPVPLPSDGIFKVEELDKSRKRVIVSYIGSDPESTGHLEVQPELHDVRWDVRCEDLAPYMLFPDEMAADVRPDKEQISSHRVGLDRVSSEDEWDSGSSDYSDSD